jgi:hypothetical protein
MDNIRHEILFIALNRIIELDNFLLRAIHSISTQMDQTITREHRVHSSGGMTHIASDVAEVITAHCVIYLEYVS